MLLPGAWHLNPALRPSITIPAFPCNSAGHWYQLANRKKKKLKEKKVGDQALQSEEVSLRDKRALVVGRGGGENGGREFRAASKGRGRIVKTDRMTGKGIFVRC